MVSRCTARTGVLLTGFILTVSPLLQAQDRDSALRALDLRYLNGVEERRTPYEQIPLIEKILELDAGLYRYWFNLGTELLRLQQYEAAAEAYETGLDLYPSPDYATLVQIFINLAICYNNSGKHQKEKAILDQASLHAPGHQAITARYVICAHSRMRYQEAEIYLEKLREMLSSEGLDPGEIAFRTGRLYMHTDHLVAEEYFRTALRYRPDDPQVQGSLAWSMIQNTMKVEEGMELMKKALEQDPENPVYIHQLGYGYYLLEMYDSALHYFRIADELYPEFNFELREHIQEAEESLEDKSLNQPG